MNNIDTSSAKTFKFVGFYPGIPTCVILPSIRPTKSSFISSMVTRKKIIKTKQMDYTSDQSYSLSDMGKWVVRPIKSPDDLLYTLNGAAGTGKTTITKEFINRLNIKRSRIAVTAPTHKAKKVIQDATGFTAETIQKLLGLRPNVNMENFNINRPVFAPMAEDQIQDFDLVLIDEGSMVNSDAFKLIRKKAAEYNVRVIFIGDSYQLPPVNEYMSKVFTDVKNQSTLTQVVRQAKSNPLTPILLQLREDVNTKSEKGINNMLSIGTSMVGDTGFKCLSPSEFSQELLNMYRSTEYEYNKNHIKFLTYTNDNIEAWSIALRKELLGEAAKHPLNVGETLTGYTTIADYKSKVVSLQNSEDYIIYKVVPHITREKIEGYNTTLKDSDGNLTTVFIVDPLKIAPFLEVFKEKLAKAKKFKGGYWKSYYNFKHKHLLLNNIYEFGRLLVGKDIYYGYGCTVHKSQGSTYDNVAINLKNIGLQYRIEDKTRLTYVALSRTRKLNLILNKNKQ